MDTIIGWLSLWIKVAFIPKGNHNIYHKVNIDNNEVLWIFTPKWILTTTKYHEYLPPKWIFTTMKCYEYLPQSKYSQQWSVMNIYPQSEYSQQWSVMNIWRS
jgi:hypothetical protein